MLKLCFLFKIMVGYKQIKKKMKNNDNMLNGFDYCFWVDFWAVFVIYFAAANSI